MTGAKQIEAVAKALFEEAGAWGKGGRRIKRPRWSSWDSNPHLWGPYRSCARAAIKAMKPRSKKP